MQSLKTHFLLRGFSQAMGVRIFSFEGVAPDRTRAAFTVQTDLALTRSYGIRLQELPLLCLAILERSAEGDQERKFTYTEEDMRVHASDCAAAREAAALKRKGPRKPPTENVGAAWRVPRW
ncbi:MAG: hypothetical protein ACKV22_10620 [Bryobacteraceae bacterium]